MSDHIKVILSTFVAPVYEELYDAGDIDHGLVAMNVIPGGASWRW